MGIPDAACEVTDHCLFESALSSVTNSLNRNLSKLLVYLEAPGAIEKTLALLETAKDDPVVKTASQSSDLILRNPQYGMDIAEHAFKSSTSATNVLCNSADECKIRMDTGTS